MKVNELRIGNLVIINNESLPETKNDIFSVIGIQSRIEKDSPNSDSVVSLSCGGSWGTYSQLNEFINPMPLTEEWLLKFGFKKNEYEENIYTFNSLDLYFGWGFDENENHWHYAHDFEKGDGYSCLWHAIDFVHQLQNLYFALTNNELELK